MSNATLAEGTCDGSRAYVAASQYSTWNNSRSTPTASASDTGAARCTAALPWRRMTSIFVRNGAPTSVTNVGSLIFAARSCRYGIRSEASAW